MLYSHIQNTRLIFARGGYSDICSFVLKFNDLSPICFCHDKYFQLTFTEISLCLLFRVERTKIQIKYESLYIKYFVHDYSLNGNIAKY